MLPKLYSKAAKAIITRGNLKQNRQKSSFPEASITLAKQSNRLRTFQFRQIWYSHPARRVHTHFASTYYGH